MKKKTIQLTVCELERDKWLNPDVKIFTPADAYQTVKDFLGNAPQEICCVINTAADGSLVDISICSMGTVDQALVSVKDILRTCVLSDAPRFIFVHNHPSGRAAPSKEDFIITQRLANAAKLLDIQMDDSIIVGHEAYYSFRESAPAALECSADTLNTKMVATVNVNDTPAEYITGSIDHTKEPIKTAGASATPSPSGPSSSAPTSEHTQDEIEPEKKEKEIYVSDSRKEMVSQFIELITSGKAAYSTMWRGAAMSPVNYKTGNAYRGGNRLTLMTSAIKNEYKDPRWMTFKQAQDAGFKIRRGEKATRLEKWDFSKKVKVIDKYGNPVKDENGRTVYEEIILARPVCKIFYVFNGEQIEGIPKYEAVTPSKDEMEKTIDALQQSSDCPVVNVAQDQSFYSPAEDKIVLPLKSVFVDSSAYAEVLAHEMAHSTGHATRLNRKIENLKETSDYNFEELVAEIGSAFVLNDLQIPPFKGDHSNAAGYLEHYIWLLKENPNILFKAASYADKAAEYIKDRYEKQHIPVLTEDKRLSAPPLQMDAENKKKEIERLIQETTRKVSYNI